MDRHASIRLWSVGGGKGGVGKSIFTMGLGLALARLGKRVVLLDGDLGGANLHTLLGMRYPPVTLEHFFTREVARLSDLAIPTQIEGLSLICGADDVLGAANPSHTQKLKLLSEIESLPADFVLVDLGAGTSFNVLDLFNYSPGKIVLFTGQATSLQSVYGFIKSSLYRHLSQAFAGETEVLGSLFRLSGAEYQDGPESLADLLARLKDSQPDRHHRLIGLLQGFHLFLVANLVKTGTDRRAPAVIQSVCSDFLNLRPQILGLLDLDQTVEAAVNRTAPLLLLQKRTRAAASFDLMARRLMALGHLAEATPVPGLREAATGRPPAFSDPLAGQAT